MLTDVKLEHPEKHSLIASPPTARSDGKLMSGREVQFWNPMYIACVGRSISSFGMQTLSSFGHSFMTVCIPAFELATPVSSGNEALVSSGHHPRAPRKVSWPPT